jgi:hypothetical protein
MNMVVMQKCLFIGEEQVLLSLQEQCVGTVLYSTRTDLCVF